MQDLVADRIRTHRGELTATERRVAEVMLEAPQTVAFGTVADVAAAAGAGAATVVRFAGKLGFDGFSDLQVAVRRELVNQLRPAAERIRTAVGTGSADRHAAIESSNVTTTLDAVDDAALADAVARLADRDHAVVVLSGDASMGVASQFVNDLGLLRANVSLLEGNEVAVRRQLATAGPSPTVVAVDLRRYDRWVLDTLATVRAADACVIALTDSVLAPLAAAADTAFVVAAGSIGPVDSHVGTMALLNLLLNETAAQLRETATARIDAIEAAWRDALTDD